MGVKGVCVVLIYLRGFFYCSFLVNAAEWLLIHPNDLPADPDDSIKRVPVDGSHHTKPCRDVKGHY